MTQRRYIQVILPLKLEWEPFYALPQDMEGVELQPGDRVLARFAGRPYLGVVSASGSDVQPPPDLAGRVQEIFGAASNKAPISASEIELWRRVASYYMCTVGEVYKAAYPSMKDETVSARLRISRDKPLAGPLDLDGDQSIALHQVVEGFSAGKSVVLTGAMQGSPQGGPQPAPQQCPAPGPQGGSQQYPAPAGEASTQHSSAFDQPAISQQCPAPSSQGGPQGVQCGLDRAELLALELARRTLEQGRNVLWLVPENKLVKALEEMLGEVAGSALLVWGSHLTPARRRAALCRVREAASFGAGASSSDGPGSLARPYLLLGTRSAVFLPHASLGLVVVSDEHDSSYKQTSPAPRYNGRDAAAILAGQSGAKMLLLSNTPSFETLYNCQCGKYLRVDIGGSRADVEYEIVDTRAELRKNGMVGEFSRVLLSAHVQAIYKPRRAAFPRIDELTSQASQVLGDEVIVTDDLIDRPLPAGITSLAVLGVDSLLGRPDFRADERAFQIVHQAVISCGPTLRKVVVQTRESSHPLFAALPSGDVSLMMEERRRFCYPPYTRIVDVLVSDSSPERSSRMSALLSEKLRTMGLKVVGLRIILPRDKSLIPTKIAIAEAVAQFEKDNRYTSHLAFDVDPLTV